MIIKYTICLCMTLVSQAVAQHVINFAQLFLSPAQYMYVFSRMSNLLSCGRQEPVAA